MRLRFATCVAAPVRAIVALLVALPCCSGDSEEVAGEIVGPSPSVPRPPSPVPPGDPEEPGVSDDPGSPDDEGGALDADAGESAPVLKGTFEAASAACNEWFPDGADAIRSVPPHGGSFACRICSAGTKSTIALARTIGPLASGSYVLSGWLGRREDRPAPDRATASVFAITSEGPVAVSASVTLRRGYVFVAVPFTLTSPSLAVAVSFHADADEGECLLVDDVFIVRHHEER